MPIMIEVDSQSFERLRACDFMDEVAKSPIRSMMVTLIVSHPPIDIYEG